MDRLRETLGIDLPDDTLHTMLLAYETMHRQIRKLRALDLTDVHPAVVYNPLLAYRDKKGWAPIPPSPQSVPCRPKSVLAIFHQ